MLVIKKTTLKKDRLLSKFFLTFFTFDLVSIPNECSISYPKIELQIEEIEINFDSTKKKYAASQAN